jgi:hypothetical protein
MSKNIQALIKKYKKSLKWNVEIERDENAPLEITSHEEDLKHCINIPQSTWPIEILHEYGHAFLIENNNILFGTSVIADGVDEQTKTILEPAFKGSVDWFVDYWMSTIVPSKEFNAYIKRSLPEIDLLKQEEFLNNTTLMGVTGLHFAELEKYLNEKPPRIKEIDEYANKFLSTDPSNLNVNNLQDLTNKILSCYTTLRIKHTVDNCFFNFWSVE